MPNLVKTIALCVALVAVCPMPVRADNSIAPQDKTLKFFQDEIRPLLTYKCLTCHSSYKKKGALDLSTQEKALKGGDNGPALVVGKSADSLLYQRVAAGEMPPNNPLGVEQVALFKEWIDAGAVYDKVPLTTAGLRAGPDWWSLQPVIKSKLPKVANKDWVRTPIDAFILAKLEEKRLKPAREADRQTYIRRVTFDLIGLPPTREEVDAFVNDKSMDAYEKLVDRLLASPHYGERWGRHWLDVVRFAESHGYETNSLRMNAWPYRDYVIRAFNNDIPYPQFILEQLAGDTLKNADFLTQSATGFLVGGAHDIVGIQTPEGALQQRMDDLDDIISATGHTFLGLTINCARCHDHKFDPISQKDYYSFQAILAGVQHSERELKVDDSNDRERATVSVAKELADVGARLDALEPLFQAGKPNNRLPVNAQRNVERFDPVDAKFVRFTILATNDKTEPCIDELEIYSAGDGTTNVALSSAGAKATASSLFPDASIHQIPHLNDGKLGNSWSWISKEPGAGWAQIELPNVAKIDRIVWGRDRDQKFRDRLPTAYRIEATIEPGKWQVVASSEDRLPFKSEPVSQSPTGLTAEQMKEYGSLLKRRQELQAKLTGLANALRIYCGSFSQPGPIHVLKRGDPMSKAEEVYPAGLSTIKLPLQISRDAPEKERRAALACWIANPDNPLASRVLANRIWHYHFGRGIVATPSDFGFNGNRPTHPELLDWLASEFKENGWHVKPLHRLILLSASYRQSGQINPNAMQIDKQNTLLWRRTPRRLEAEAIRDSILSVSGKLDLKMGGPGYDIWEPNTNYVTVFKSKLDLGPAEFRRMVYQFKPRSQQDPTFGTFDCPDAALARPKRTESITVLQALNLFNSRFALSQAGFFAERVKREAGDDSARQVERAFQLAFGRKPMEAESAASVKIIVDHGLSALCRVLYNANEFMYVD
jgi:hypothetical protein